MPLVSIDVSKEHIEAVRTCQGEPEERQVLLCGPDDVGVCTWQDGGAYESDVPNLTISSREAAKEVAPSKRKKKKGKKGKPAKKVKSKAAAKAKASATADDEGDDDDSDGSSEGEDEEQVGDKGAMPAGLPPAEVPSAELPSAEVPSAELPPAGLPPPGVPQEVDDEHPAAKPKQA